MAMPDSLQLLWSPKSPYVRKVMVVAIETGTVHRIETIRTVATVTRPNPDLMRDNPLSKVPTLRFADGNVLYDSAVICEFLDALAGTTLFPKGDARWRALRWQALGDGVLDTVVLWRHEKERVVAMQSADLLAAYRTKTLSALQSLENEVGVLQNSALSIGHVTVGCALGYLDFRMADLDWRAVAPKLADWFTELMRRPSFASTVPRL